MRTEKAHEYRGLIQSFVESETPVVAFEAAFLEKFKTESASDLDQGLFAILQNLFEDLDAYSPMWTEKDETPFRITETSLRKEARIALAELDKYLRQSTPS